MTENEFETRWQRLISPINPVSFTDGHHHLIAHWPEVPDAFISHYDRREHARRRVFDNHPMALQEIAFATDTPTDLLSAAWDEFNASYPFHVIGDSHREIAERWLGLVIRALDSLQAIGECIPMMGIRAELRQPTAERKFLELLGRRPKGAAIGLAAAMVLLATPPEEVYEAEVRRTLADPDEPKLVRSLSVSGGSGLVRELWTLPVPLHPKVTSADVVVVECLIGDPPPAATRAVLGRLTIAGGRPSLGVPQTVVDLGERPRVGRVSVARGPRVGERIGVFPSDRNRGRTLRMTGQALAELARTGTLPEPS